jgi:Flp pilus assembly protein TadD
MAQALLAEGHVAAAREQLERLAEDPRDQIRPDNVPPWLEEIVSQLIRRRALGLADSLLNQAGPLPTRRPELQALSAGLLVLANRVDEAIAVYEAIRTTDPELQRRVHHELATLYLARGEAEPALDRARDGLALAPEHGPLRVLVAEALRALGRKEEAREELALLPESTGRWVAEAQLYLEAFDRPDTAVTLLERATQASPREPRYLLQLGRALLAAGRPAQAARTISPLARATTPFGDSQTLLAEAWEKMGRTAAADSLRGIVRARNERELLRELRTEGLQFSMAGALDSALTRFDRAIAVDPDLAELHNDRGAVLARMERWEEAEAAFLAAAELTPNDPTVYQNLARLYHRLDRAEERDRMVARWEELTAAPDSSGS